MVFDPKLNAEFSFNRPTTNTSSISAVESLFSFAASTLKSTNSGGSNTLTADEKFSIDFAEYVNNQPPSWKLDSKSMRDFIMKHPQHTDKMTNYAESLGVVTKPFVETARDTGVEDFLKTPEGVLAANEAAKAATVEESNAIVLGAMTSKADLDARIAAQEREKKAGETQSSIDSRNWETIGDYQRNFADSIVSSVVSPVVSSVMNGNSYKLTPEEAASLGLPYQEINMNNLPQFLLDVRTGLKNYNATMFANTYGYSASMPPKEWEDRVLGGIDFLIDEAKQISSPQERAAAMNAILESNVYKNLDKAGLATASYVLKNFPPEITQQFLADPELLGAIGSVITDDSGAVLGQEAIRAGISDMSKKEAETIVKKVVGLGATSDPTFFGLFKEAQARSGYKVVDGASWQSIIGKNVESLKSHAESDPAFRTEFSSWISGDINQTIIAIERQLPPEVEIILKDGKFLLAIKAGISNEFTIADVGPVGSAILASAGKTKTGEALKALDKQLNMDVLNQKYTSLKLIGSVGKEVSDAIGMQYAPAEVKGGAGDTAVKGGPNGDIKLQEAKIKEPTPASKIDHNWVVGGLTARGMPEHIAIGFAMNFKDESAFNPGVIGDNGASLGLAQWYGPRKKALETFAASRGMPATDPNVQLDYLIHELGGPQSAAWQKIKNAKTPQEAAMLILNEFERPAEKHRAAREKAYLGASHDPSVSLSYGYPGADTSPQGLAQSNFNAIGAVAPEPGMAQGAPERAATAQVDAQATPVADTTDKAPQRLSDALLERAKEILVGKPLDADVKALIEALIGGK